MLVTVASGLGNWQTPGKIWALVVVTAVIAAVVGYQAGRELAKPRPSIVINLVPPAPQK